MLVLNPASTLPVLVDRDKLMAQMLRHLDGGVSLDPYPSIRLWMRAARSLPGFIEMQGIHRLHEFAPGPKVTA